MRSWQKQRATWSAWLVRAADGSLEAELAAEERLDPMAVVNVTGASGMSRPGPSQKRLWEVLMAASISDELRQKGIPGGPERCARSAVEKLAAPACPLLVEDAVGWLLAAPNAPLSERVFEVFADVPENRIWDEIASGRSPARFLLPRLCSSMDQERVRRFATRRGREIVLSMLGGPNRGPSGSQSWQNLDALCSASGWFAAELFRACESSDPGRPSKELRTAAASWVSKSESLGKLGAGPWRQLGESFECEASSLLSALLHGARAKALPLSRACGMFGAAGNWGGTEWGRAVAAACEERSLDSAVRSTRALAGLPAESGPARKAVCSI